MSLCSYMLYIQFTLHHHIASYSAAHGDTMQLYSYTVYTVSLQLKCSYIVSVCSYSAHSITIAIMYVARVYTVSLCSWLQCTQCHYVATVQLHNVTACVATVYTVLLCSYSVHNVTACVATVYTMSLCSYSVHNVTACVATVQLATLYYYTYMLLHVASYIVHRVTTQLECTQCHYVAIQFTLYHHIANQLQLQCSTQ